MKMFLRNAALIVALLVVAVPMGGCAQLQAVTDGLSIVTKSVANPVTKEDEAKVELVLDTAVQALLAYRKACIAGTADKNCRENIDVIQPYTRKIKPLVAQLRDFVDNNDQINAPVVYNQLTALYNNIKNVALARGVNIGS